MTGAWPQPPRRRGRPLRPMPSSLFLHVPSLGAIAPVLAGSGYVLVPRTTPYHRGDGAVFVRLVWRRRDDACIVQQQVLLSPIPEPLLSALLDSVGAAPARAG